MMYCLLLVMAVLHGTTGRTTTIESAQLRRSLVGSHGQGQQRRRLNWWGWSDLYQSLNHKRNRGIGNTSTKEVDCSSSSMDEMDESCGDRYYNYINSQTEEAETEEAETEDVETEDTEAEDAEAEDAEAEDAEAEDAEAEDAEAGDVDYYDEDSAGSASYLSANGNQDQDSSQLQESYSLAVPLVLIALAVVVAGAALVAARSRQRGNGKMGFIEVSKVTRAKEADDKGSPFLSEEEQSAAEVDSATEVGYGVCEGGSVASAAEVGSNAAEVV